MARHYGGSINPGSVPSSVEAPGAFNSFEQGRQRQLDAWPSDITALPSVVPGAYLFALSSGGVDSSSTSFLLPDGRAVSRTSYVELFNAIGTTYGVGDGSTTFNLPDLTSSYNYLKTTTTSGATLAQLSGVAVLPSHTHTVNGISTVYSQPTACGPSGNNRNMTATTVNVGNKGSANGNEARHRQVIPLISPITTAIPIGFLCPFLLPENESVVAASLSASSFAVLSGQLLSKDTYPALFNNINYLYGSGDDSVSFRLPDFTGLFPKNILGLNPTTPQVSGVLPSGYILDDFAQHSHTATFQLTNVTTNCPGPSSAGSSVGSPPTGGSSVGSATENRPNNISVVYAIRLE
jgi:microcystin-dependent protein